MKYILKIVFLLKLKNISIQQDNLIQWFICFHLPKIDMSIYYIKGKNFLID